MEIYLPIAALPVNIFLLLFLGGATGILAGMFGVGGGFIMTPLLIFIGIPPAIAVSSSANQIIASSFSGFIAHMRRQNVDFKIGALMLLGGLIGSTLGVGLFTLLEKWGLIDLAISLSYVAFLGTIGVLMAIESFRTIRRNRSGTYTPKPKKAVSTLSQKLPFQMEFPRSKITISALLPVIIGFGIGILVSLMGVGGGFLLVPAMIYLLRMPTSVVIGTSLFQITVIATNVTFLYAMRTHTVDIVLAMIMLCGSVVGAQIGMRISVKIAPEYLRAMMAVMVLAIVSKLAYGLFITPTSPYEIIAP